MTEENKKVTRNFFGKIGNYIANFSSPAGNHTTLVGFQYKGVINKEKGISHQKEKQISELEQTQIKPELKKLIGKGGYGEVHYGE